MSSSHERVRVTEQLQTSSPEVPQRPIRAPIPPVPVTQSHHSQRPAVREIHKNAWLRPVSGTEKKGAPFIRKGDKLWVVFCVHDDVEAFLEFYPDPKVGGTHKPISHISLNNCQHVSSSIVGTQDKEFQFAVTLPTEVIRLYAASWEQMMEWVESLQGKLREMNILSPKDNIYSKLPESRMNNSSFNATNYPLSFGLGHVSTRDPNSPLPPTPNGHLLTEPIRPSPPVSAPVQPVSRGNQEDHAVYIEPSIAPQERLLGGGGCRRGCIFGSNFNATQVPEPMRRNDSPPASLISGLDEPISTGGTAIFYVQQCSSSRDGSGSDSGNGSGGSIISIEPRTISAANKPHPSSPLPPRRPPEIVNDLITLTPSVAVVVGNSNTTVVQVGCDESTLLIPNFTNAAVTTPILIPELLGNSNGLESLCVSKSSVEPTPSTSTTTTTPNPALYSVVNKQKKLPRPTSRATKVSESNNLIISNKPPQPPSTTTTTNSILTNIKPSLVNTAAAPTASSERQLSSLAPIQSGQINPQLSSSSENIYEHLYVPDTTNSHSKFHQIISSTSTKVADSDSEATPPLIPKRNPVPKRLQKVNNNSNRSSSLSRLEESNSSSAGRTNGTRENGRLNESSGNNRNRGHRQDVIRQITGNGNPVEDSVGSPQLPGLEGRPMEAMIDLRNGEYRIRREELPGGSQSQGDTQSQSSGSGGSTANISNSLTNGSGPLAQIPLKEQQVMRLKSEINHSGGVRVVLRKKNCVDSIAFIDYLGAVWIAGWKQHEHPVLYYAFHVGDQVLKVAGVTIQNSVEAYRAIKMVSSMQVEFILRRLPFGRVFVLKRSREGEQLGLVAVRNSGEIGEVMPNGLASTQGLPPKSPAMDGKTNCNWFLTEINNRPLSLMARENEVRDRLNAVGKEISILVQPSDLVKHLRKNLKSLRGFKDYLIV